VSEPSEDIARYAVVIEPADDGSYSAYVPALPGCVACGGTVDEVRREIADAIELHTESLRRHGEDVPWPIRKPGGPGKWLR
jgi:predicted RNase H-like HicB family nuclease